MSEGKKTSKGVKAQNARVASGWDKYDKREGFALDDERIASEEKYADKAGGEYRSQVGRGLIGRWAPNSPQDEDRRLLAKAVNHQKADDRYPDLKMDVATAVEWERQDDNKVLQQRHNYLLQQTLSSKDPFQRSLVLERFPILENVPQQYYESQVQDQMRLYYLLQQGEIKSEDDNLFVLHVCHINYVIPTFPIWDPFGKATEKYSGSDTNLRSDQGKLHGIFHPRTLGILPQTSIGPTIQLNRPADVAAKLIHDPYLKTQVAIKAYILKELYPNIREAPLADSSEIIAKVIFGFASMVDDYQTGDTLFNPAAGRSNLLKNLGQAGGAYLNVNDNWLPVIAEINTILKRP